MFFDLFWSCTCCVITVSPDLLYFYFHVLSEDVREFECISILCFIIYCFTVYLQFTCQFVWIKPA